MQRNSVLRPIRILRAVGVAAAAACALLAAGPTAMAVPEPPPSSGDDRATAVAGNAVTCADLGLPGGDIKGELTYEVRENTYLDVRGVDDGTTVALIAVKGGPAYNVYLPEADDELPWIGLHSPLVSSGDPAQISHWFACGVITPPTSSTSSTSTVPSTGSATSTTTSSTTRTAGSTTAPSTSSSAVVVAATPVSTTTAGTAVVANTSLASTGFGAGWLVPAGLLLVLGGAGLVLWQRRGRSTGR